jgi:quercetin dioxygenase-like cupin family protein
MDQKTYRIFKILIVAALSIVFHEGIAQKTDSIKTSPRPQVITLNLDSTSYQEILSGSPSSVGMYSGLVTIKPGETVGHHNTEKYEEMLVIFSGIGQMTFDSGQALNLKYGVVAYCPPYTEHDVKNTGTADLKYLYIAAQTK